MYLEILVEKCKYNIKDRKKKFFVVKVMEASSLASITDFSHEPRRARLLAISQPKNIFLPIFWLRVYIISSI